MGRAASSFAAVAATALLALAGLPAARPLAQTDRKSVV